MKIIGTESQCRAVIAVLEHACGCPILLGLDYHPDCWQSTNVIKELCHKCWTELAIEVEIQEEEDSE